MSYPLKSQLAVVINASLVVEPRGGFTSLEAACELLANRISGITTDSGLPESDPQAPGRLWLSSGVPAVSQG